MPKEDATNEAWVEELKGRHEEALKVALRNFMVSRQFMTNGSLSEADRLARFYEGVVMSLQRNPFPEAFDAAVSAFRAVIRYEAKPSKDGAASTDPAKRALRVQAAYNLAVLYHRRAVQLREAKNKGKVKVENGNENKQQGQGKPEKGEPPIISGKVLEAILTSELQQNQATDTGPNTWKVIAELKDRTTKDDKGSDEDEDEYRKIRTELLKEATKRYKEVVDAVNQWGLKYEQLKRAESWHHVILATGVAAMVGTLLLVAEQFNTQEGGAMELTDAESGELERLLGAARSALDAPAEGHSEANPLEGGEAEGRTPGKEAPRTLRESWKKFATLFVGEIKKRRRRNQAVDLNKNIENEMLQQLDRAARRLSLPRKRKPITQ